MSPLALYQEANLILRFETAQGICPPTEDEINLQIGKRIRRRRRLLGLTQGDLSHELGLKFQQIQKYECAANRVGASRLFRMAGALKVPVQYFFDGLHQNGHAGAPANDHDLVASDEMLSSKEARELIEAYFRLSDPIRRRLRDFARVLSEERA